jgi:hypothetical protein
MLRFLLMRLNSCCYGSTRVITPLYLHADESLYFGGNELHLDQP